MERFLLSIALACLVSQAEVPSAIFTDPPRDNAHPMHNEAVWIPSGGVSMNGVMYAAAGVQPHPTAVILHGLPGNEQNLDLAQTLRRAGYNVLSFHFRGSWGSPGKFTLANGVEDGQASIAFIEDPANVAKFHIDPKRIILIGHSFGGFVAARVAAAHPRIAATILIAPWSPAEDVSFLKVAPEKLAATAHRAFDDVEGRLGGYADVDLAKEILAPGYDWHLESSAAAIKNMRLLIIVAKHDSPGAQANTLIPALKAAKAVDATSVWIDTDHAFADHRIALEAGILDWLGKRRQK